MLFYFALCCFSSQYQAAHRNYWNCIHNWRQMGLRARVGITFTFCASWSRKTLDYLLRGEVSETQLLSCSFTAPFPPTLCSGKGGKWKRPPLSPQPGPTHTRNIRRSIPTFKVLSDLLSHHLSDLTFNIQTHLVVWSNISSAIFHKIILLFHISQYCCHCC